MRNSRRRRSRFRERLLRSAPAAIGALAVAWLVVVVGFAARMDRSYPATVLDDAADKSMSEPLDAADRQAVRTATVRAPLTADAFFVEAVRAAQAEDGARATALLEEARRRDPRHRQTRLYLLQEYVRADRVADASKELVALARLIPQSSDLLVGQLARLAADPTTRAATRRALRDPETLNLVLERLARSGASPDVVLGFAGAHARHVPGAQPQWQAVLVDSVARNGDINEAHALWRRFAGLGADAADGTVYDPEFRGLPGGAPFNWAFQANETGVVERGRPGTIEVSYFGRQSGELASQLMTLAPGVYQIRFRAEGSASGDGSRLVWRAYCRGSDTPILELPVVDVNYAPRAFAARFTVPATGCEAQWLRLEGQSAEFPRTQSATISAFSIQQAGAAQ